MEDQHSLILHKLLAVPESVVIGIRIVGQSAPLEFLQVGQTVPVEIVSRIVGGSAEAIGELINVSQAVAVRIRIRQRRDIESHGDFRGLHISVADLVAEWIIEFSSRRRCKQDQAVCIADDGGHGGDECATMDAIRGLIKHAQGGGQRREDRAQRHVVLVRSGQGEDMIHGASLRQDRLEGCAAAKREVVTIGRAVGRNGGAKRFVERPIAGQARLVANRWASHVRLNLAWRTGGLPDT